jgi:hypothetical protein
LTIQSKLVQPFSPAPEMLARSRSGRP